VIGVSLAGVTSRQIQLDAVASLPAHSFLIDGEAIVTDAKGLAVFNLICRQRHNSNICRGQGWAQALFPAASTNEAAESGIWIASHSSARSPRRSGSR
jgi:hypothetical protein